MRLTIDPTEDPHAAAEHSLIEGRPKFAMYILSEAIKLEPTRTDLRQHLARIKMQMTSRERAFPRRSMPVAAGVLHAILAWVLLVALMASILVAPLVILEAVAPMLLERCFQNEGWNSLIFILLTLVWGVFGLWIALNFFIACWFSYLNLLPATHALAADAYLPAAMATWQFGKIYTAARKSYFAKRYG